MVRQVNAAGRLKQLCEWQMLKHPIVDERDHIERKNSENKILEQ